MASKGPLRRVWDAAVDRFTLLRSSVASSGSRWHLPVLGIIVAVALYFRIRRLGAPPFWIDESFTAWAARNYVEGRGFSNPVGPSSPYRRAWLTTTSPVAVSFAVFGHSEFAARLPMVLYGMGSVVVTYFLAARYGRLLGYLVAAFVAFDPFVVVWSREARMYAPLMFFYVASIYVVSRWRGDGFSLSSPALVILVPLAVLGAHTHPVFLGFGAGLGAYFVVTSVARLEGLDAASVRRVDRETRRVWLLTVGGLLASSAFLLIDGVPAVLLAEPAATWPESGPTYYWELFGRAYPLLRYLLVPGTFYAWIRYERSRPAVLVFLIPLVVLSLSPRRAPRYVYHLLPLVGLFGLVPVADGLAFIWRKVTEGDQNVGTFDAALSYSVPVLVVLVVASPLAGYAVADATYEPPYHPGRSDWAGASEFVGQRANESDVIVSTRPELSMWYLGRTEYFFRQNGVSRAEQRDGGYVHARTGTIYLDDVEDVRRLASGNRDVWLLAGKKFYGSFTDPAARRLVKETFEEVGNSSWENMEVYHYDAEES